MEIEPPTCALPRPIKARLGPQSSGLIPELISRPCLITAPLVSKVSSSAGADEWLRRGRRNLRIAKSLVEAGFGDGAAFYAHQGAEFALKALQIFRKGTFDRVHDLTKLARDLGAPARIVKLASDVTPLYTGSRYPDIGRRITRQLAEATLEKARRIARWVRRQMV